MIYCKRAAPLQPPGQTDALNLSRLYSMMEVSGKMTRACLKIGDVPSDEGFWPLASNLTAGILADFKGTLRCPAVKRPADWVC